MAICLVNPAKSKPKKKPKTSTTARPKCLLFFSASTTVVKENINETVIAEKFVTSAELCEGAFAAACKERDRRLSMNPDAPLLQLGDQ